MSEPVAKILDVPVIIIAFDRPEYLDRLCAALAAQKRVAIDRANVHLVQDGGWSPRTKKQCGDEALIAQSEATFRRHFPEGRVWKAEENLGIAFNIRRAEMLAFEEMDAPLAYFFEDDLEPGPLYLWAMERLRAMIEALPGPSGGVGYFAAYGEHHVEHPGPDVAYVPMEHHWGFGLSRSAWRRIDAQLAPFYRILRGRDYRLRDHRRVLELYAPRAHAVGATSQDAAKALACIEMGLAKVMTSVNFARYIGEKGQSFNAESFVRTGFDRMRINPREDYVFPPLTAERVAWLAKYHRDYARRFRAEKFDAVLAAKPARLPLK